MPKSKEDALGRSVAEKLHKAETTSAAWGIKLEDAGEGWAHASMIIRDDMLNGHGIAHGGIIFSLADTVFAWACNSRNVQTVAQHASISFLRPVLEGEKLLAKARKISTSGRNGAYLIEIFGGDGAAVAVFNGLSRSIGGSVVETGDESND